MACHLSNKCESSGITQTTISYWYIVWIGFFRTLFARIRKVRDHDRILAIHYTGDIDMYPGNDTICFCYYHLVLQLNREFTLINTTNTSPQFVDARAEQYKHFSSAGRKWQTNSNPTQIMWFLHTSLFLPSLLDGDACKKGSRRMEALPHYGLPLCKKSQLMRVR